ncbi:MAG: RagB/SusD family nutrient uptake outer membrane protein [Sediminibacterium sp.]
MNTYYGQTVGSIPGTAGRGDMDVQTAWVNRHTVGDVRRTFFVTTNRRLTQKHLDRFGHVPVIRLAEMYLTRAEANFRLGTSVGAAPAADIKRIRDRAGLPEITAGSLTLANILLERDLELAFEGHYLHDRKRLRESMPGSAFTNGPAWNSPRLVLPIPQRETDVNKNLVQNEGY